MTRIWGAGRASVGLVWRFLGRFLSPQREAWKFNHESVIFGRCPERNTHFWPSYLEMGFGILFDASILFLSRGHFLASSARWSEERALRSGRLCLPALPSRFIFRMQITISVNLNVRVDDKSSRMTQETNFISLLQPLCDRLVDRPCQWSRMLDCLF